LKAARRLKQGAGLWLSDMFSGAGGGVRSYAMAEEPSVLKFRPQTRHVSRL